MNIEKYKAPSLKLDSIDISKLNIDIDISIKSKGLILSDKLNISLVLIEKMTNETMMLFFKKIQSIGVLNEVVLKMLKEAVEIEITDIKKYFLGIATSRSKIYNIFLKDVEKDSTKLKKFIDNTIHCCDNESIDILINHESIIFNIYRKTLISETKKYIENEIVPKLKNKSIKILIQKLK